MPIYPYPHGHELAYPTQMSDWLYSQIEFELWNCFEYLEEIQQEIGEKDGSEEKIRKSRQEIRNSISYYTAVLCCRNYYKLMRKHYKLKFVKNNQ